MPFKLTSDYIEMMDGAGSEHFLKFKMLVDAGLTEVKRNLKELENIILILSKGKLCLVTTILESRMPCFAHPETLAAELGERLRF